MDWSGDRTPQNDFEYPHEKQKKVFTAETFFTDSDFDTPTSPTRTNTSLTDDNNGQPDSKTFEKPKVVASSRRRDALMYGVAYHLLAVLVTALMTIAYAQEWRWPYPGPSDEVMAALQFAAKLHECLLILSLSNIIFHRLRYMLLRCDGLPLGLLTTPFQLNNPFFFVSPEFLGALRKLFSGVNIFLTFMLIGAIALLSFAASPFSAVVLIPREIRFLASGSHSMVRNLLESGKLSGPQDAEGFYGFDTFAIPPEGLYPMAIGPELGVTWSCPAVPSRPGNCLSFFQAQFADIFAASWTGAGPSQLTLLDTDPRGITEGGDQAILEIGDVRVVKEELYVAFPYMGPLYRTSHPLWPVTTSLVRFSNRAFAQQLQLGDSYPLMASAALADSNGEKLPAMQPQILTQACLRTVEVDRLSLEYLTGYEWGARSSDPELLGGYLCFGTGLYPAFNFTMNDELASLLLRQDWVKGFHLFVDLQDHVPFPISGGYITVEPSRRPELVAELAEDAGFYQNMRIAFFIAQWAPAEPSSIQDIKIARGPQGQGILAGKFAKPFEDRLNMTAETVGPVVRMDTAWLNSLDIFPFEAVPLAGFPRLDNNSRSLFDHVAAMNDAQGSVVSVLLAAVMSAVQLSYGTAPPDGVMCLGPKGTSCLFASDLPGDPDQPLVQYEFRNQLPAGEIDKPENQLHVRIRIDEDAWGYSFQGVTIILAFVFLYSHLLLVVVHLVIMAFGGWSSTAWTCLTDFVVLGIGSASSDLVENAGAGVGSWRTWSFLTSVRNVKREDRLELVICDQEREEYGGLLGRERTEENKKYA
ncbi:hypothetical protein OQA88_3074 [Cercophora sp. LCS_1]